MPNTAVATNVLGGPFNGYSPAQTVNNYKDSDQANIRTILRRSWNGQYASGTVNGHKRIVTPFRAVNNSGDFLARQNYTCGGPNQINSRPDVRGLSIGSVLSHCDQTNVPASSCNPKFVADSSDYITYKKQRAMNVGYNDSSNGGDAHNGSYVNLMAVRRT